MPSTQFRGFLLGVGEGGLMTVTIPLAQANLVVAARHGPGEVKDDVVAAAVYSPDAGGTIDLTGTYNVGTRHLSLNGCGYIMAGEYDPVEIVRAVIGFYAGPERSAYFHCAVGGAERVQVCRAKHRNASKAQDRLSMLMVGDDLFGMYSAVDSMLGFHGKVTGTGSVRTVSVREVRSKLTLIVDGTFHTMTGEMQGQWRIEVDSAVVDSGIWEGSTR